MLVTQVSVLFQARTPGARRCLRPVPAPSAVSETRGLVVRAGEQHGGCSPHAGVDGASIAFIPMWIKSGGSDGFNHREPSAACSPRLRDTHRRISCFSSSSSRLGARVWIKHSTLESSLKLCKWGCFLLGLLSSRDEIAGWRCAACFMQLRSSGDAFVGNAGAPGKQQLAFLRGQSYKSARREFLLLLLRL